MTADVKPEATDEISDNNSNDNETNDLVHIQEHILRNDTLITRLITHKLLDDVRHSSNINQLYQSWKSKKTKQLGQITRREQDLKWED